MIFIDDDRGNRVIKTQRIICALILAMDKGIRSIAYPLITTGIYRFPVDLAAMIAVNTVVRFLSVNKDVFDLVEWSCLMRTLKKSMKAK